MFVVAGVRAHRFNSPYAPVQITLSPEINATDAEGILPSIIACLIAGSNSAETFLISTVCPTKTVWKTPKMINVRMVERKVRERMFCCLNLLIMLSLHRVSCSMGLAVGLNPKFSYRYAIRTQKNILMRNPGYEHFFSRLLSQMS